MSPPAHTSKSPSISLATLLNVTVPLVIKRVALVLSESKLSIVTAPSSVEPIMIVPVVVS